MNKCKHCGRDESEHHDFEPDLTMPVGCVCDPGTWAGCQNGVPPICSDYSGPGYCGNCEHDEACHNAPKIA